MVHANRKPNSRIGPSKTATGGAQFFGYFVGWTGGSVVRLILAPGALAFALLDVIGSFAVCCSASVARAEGAAAAPQARGGNSPVPLPFRQEQREYERIKGTRPRPITDNQTREDLGFDLGSVPLSFPKRGPLVGDFWRPGEFGRHLEGR
jgi:hypothetical protein